MACALPSWASWYKKPSYVDLKTFTASLNKRAEEVHAGRLSSRDSFSSIRTEESIPKDLSLEQVLANKTCSPMSLYDFYMYLKHIEYSQENLEFYFWFKDFEQRCKQRLARAPELKRSNESKVDVVSVAPTLDTPPSEQDEDKLPQEAIHTDTVPQISPDFIFYIESLITHKAARYPRPCYMALRGADLCSMATKPLNNAHTPQPPPDYAELCQITNLFLKPLSPKELNIPPSLRQSALSAIQSQSEAQVLLALSKIAEHTYDLLKYGSHRNFVRLGVNNGTFETLCMVTFIGITMSLAGFLTMLTLVFASPRIHESSCWRGLATIPFWIVGFSFLFAGMRGSCFLLLLFSRRQQLPWERLEEMKGDQRDTVAVGDGNCNGKEKSGNPISRFTRKLMIAERRIRVKDMGLRRLQRKIVIQSVIGAIVGTAILEVFFLCLPIWK